MIRSESPITKDRQAKDGTVRPMTRLTNILQVKNISRLTGPWTSVEQQDIAYSVHLVIPLGLANIANYVLYCTV